MGGYQSAAEFFTVIGRGLYDPRLQATMSTGDGTAGGFAVPPAILGPWLDQSLESEIVRSRAIQSSGVFVSTLFQIDRKDRTQMEPIVRRALGGLGEF
jgi:hypothetical protein